MVDQMGLDAESIGSCRFCSPPVATPILHFLRALMLVSRISSTKSIGRQAIWAAVAPTKMALALAKRPGRMSLRIENGAVTADDPATASRVHSWAGQNIVVDGRPDWVFVKVYTPGAPDKQAASLLSDHGRSMHRALREHYNDGRSWKLHYVTAREMYNVAKAALAGKSGDPNDYRDFELSPPPILSGLSG